MEGGADADAVRDVDAVVVSDADVDADTDADGDALPLGVPDAATLPLPLRV